MTIDVSIIIICMNNLKLLRPCLNSIRKYTCVSYEVVVVAYLFSEENKEIIKKEFPWIKIIYSDEIRGFSENNNIGLRIAKGQYCFLLNDDTYFDSPVIDDLVYTMNSLPNDIAVLSPKILNVDGSVQKCGRPKYNLITEILRSFNLLSYYEKHSKYTNKKGVFMSYNILGAAFLIRTSIFKEMGWFDERYFFCPEDIALSSKLNKAGYLCFVKENCCITHIGGGSWSKTIRATKPATIRGNVIMFQDHSLIESKIYLCWMVMTHFIKYLYWKFISRDKEKKHTMLVANKNAIIAALSKKTPKDLFIRFYKEISG